MRLDQAAASLTTGFPIMMLGAAAGYDGGTGQGAYFAVFNYANPAVTAGLQFKINAIGGNGALAGSNVLTGTGWIFVAATYDSTLATNHVKFYVGHPGASLGAPVSTVTYGAGAAVNFGTTGTMYLLNRNGRDRAFSGLGDDFRFYDGALDAGALENVRASSVSNTAPAPAVSPLYQWNFNTATSGTTAAPQVGVGGDLTLRNAADAATDLHTPIGGGVSGSSSAAPPTIRRAHYPASREFYQEADRLGVLVLDELAGWQHAYSDTAAPPLVRELVIRDVNHPCVIAWGNGNESGWNTTVDDDYSLWDPQNRTVLHPATYDHLFGGFKTHHYSNYALIQSNYLGASKAAFMPTENLHGLFDGGAGAGLSTTGKPSATPRTAPACSSGPSWTRP